MSERLMPAADVDAVLHRAGDVVFGASRRVVQRIAERQPRRDGGRERAAGAVGVRTVEARRRKHLVVDRLDEHVDRLVALQMTALDDDGCGTRAAGCAGQRRACRRRMRMVMPASTSASGTFGVTTRASRSSDRRIACTASSSSRRSPPLATITGSTTRFGRSSASTAAATASTMAAVASMPVLTASQPISRDDRFDLQGHELCRHDVDAGHAERVLRRQRGDRRGAVDAVRRERLEVGLDPGAPARVASRNCQRAFHLATIARYAIPRPVRHLRLDAARPRERRRRFVCRAGPASGSRRCCS